ncbi:uncharacterized protein LOC111085811 isoform X3 [Limulus polyphemus]|uniref:Uncharacterized protein LOC111085811 isoform X3 n=1 Tax=Limulus polyphemus TaxID=6850 RepID=A0ABM1SDW9_LIMPO|nr:uncharacterized protein LOC111085811 isoform X3 [Limulus polyphemus]
MYYYWWGCQVQQHICVGEKVIAGSIIKKVLISGKMYLTGMPETFRCSRSARTPWSYWEERSYGPKGPYGESGEEGAVGSKGIRGSS